MCVLQSKFTRNKPNKYLNGVARASYAGPESALICEIRNYFILIPIF